MFLRGSGKPYSKETRENEFIRYIRDTGTAKALEQAMITLYKMPIKPTNIQEFFAEYLGDGAKRLIRLSLLKAELCYKNSETQDIHKSIQRLEKEIRKLEPHDEVFENRKPSLYFEGEMNTYSLMERFLDDLQDAPRGSAVTTAVHSVVEVAPSQSQKQIETLPIVPQDNVPEEHDGNNPVDTRSVLFNAEEKVDSELEESPEVNCIPEEDSMLAFQRDVKSLDPWGIVCGFLPNQNDQKESKSKSKAFLKGPETLSLMGSEPLSEAEKAYKNYDSDDAETLAEIYQNLAVDLSGDAPKNRLEVIENVTTDTKLLSVKNAARLSMADLLGWPAIPKPTNMQHNHGDFDRQDPLTSQREQGPLHWYELIANRKAPDSDMDITNDEADIEVTAEDASNMKINPEEDEYDMDDSYLLQEDMRRIAKKLHKAWSDESCVLDFPMGHNSEVEESCAEACRHSCHRPSKSDKRKDKKEQGTMTIDTEKECPCGEDCDCSECGLGRTNGSISRKFGSQIPGRMSNWTQNYDCLPGEDYDLLGEDENIKCFRRKPKKSEARKSSFGKGFVKDMALARTSETECQCHDLSTSSSKTLSECMQTCRQNAGLQNQRDPADPTDKRGNSMNEETMTLTDKEMKRQSEGLKKLSEPGDREELVKVFKSRRSYPSGSLDDDQNSGNKTKRKTRKSSFLANVEEGEKLPYLGDAYQLDLGKEVRRRFDI